VTYEQAQMWVDRNYIVKREAWPESTWLCRALPNDLIQSPRVRTQSPFHRQGKYLLYMPTQEDLAATDWSARPS
jgi:hypothetical protein